MRRPRTRTRSTRPTSRSTTSSSGSRSSCAPSASRREPRRRLLGGRARLHGAARALVRAAARLRARSACRARAASCSRSTTSHWIDVPVVRHASPRDLDFVAKIEAHSFPGLGQFIRAFGTIAVRRGESDREAVRLMREVVRDGHALGLFVEGTRQKNGVARARRSRARRWSRSRRTCPSSRPRSTGRSSGSPATSQPCSIALGEPMHFDGLPKNGRGYREATAEIEARDPPALSTGSPSCTRAAARSRSTPP